MAPAPPEPDTPAGMVVIRVHQPEPEFRCTFTLDPARDWIATRQVEVSRFRDGWYRRERRATRFEQLPGGAWVVAAWEGREGATETPDRALAGKSRDQLVAITPLGPDEFPPGIFDGAKFIAEARERGDTIETDR